MTERRAFLIDDSHDMTFYEVTELFTQSGLDPEAVEKVLYCLQYLFPIRVIRWKLDDLGRNLLIDLCVPNEPMSEEEAVVRCKAYDKLLLAGEEKTATTPGIARRRQLFRKHNYSPEKLRNLSDFMHDAIRAICCETVKCRAARGEEKERPYALRQFTCRTFEVADIPPVVKEEHIEQLRQKCKDEKTAITLTKAVIVSRRAIGSPDYLMRIDPPPPVQSPRKKLCRLRLLDTAVWVGEDECVTEDQEYHIFKDVVSFRRELIEIATGCGMEDEVTAWLDNLATHLLGGRQYITLADMLMLGLSPIVLLLWMANRLLQWRKRERLRKQGLLQKLEEEALRRALKINGLEVAVSSLE